MEGMFALTYGVPGIGWSDVKEMEREEYFWMINRLVKQKKREIEEIEKARSKGRG